MAQDRAVSPLISLVMPCFNEADVLALTVPPLVSGLRQMERPFELILVDNGSRDGTGAVIDRLASEHPFVRRVTLERNQGLGFGVRSGLEAAQGDLVGFLAADGQIRPEDVVRVVRIAEAADPTMLVKVRRVTREDGRWRWFVSRVYNGLFLILFGVTTTDVNGTPKIMRRSVLQKMALRSDDWFLDSEIMIKAKAHALAVVEVPAPFLKRAGGRSALRWTTVFEFLANMFRWKFGRLSRRRGGLPMTQEHGDKVAATRPPAGGSDRYGR